MTDSRRLTRFAVVATLLYIGWYFLYNQVILPSGHLDQALMLNIAQASAGLLRVFGLNATAPAEASWMPTIAVDNSPAVVVGYQCDGLVLYALFAGFVVAYPGRWQTKLWFIPLGILAIYGVNILRVAALVLNFLWSRASVEFNHHYTFTVIVYAFIFWLWTIWVRHLAAPLTTGPNHPSSSPDPNAV